MDSTETSYVVTFNPHPVAGPGALEGLRRMSLTEALETVSLAASIPRAGRVINAHTLEEHRRDVGESVRAFMQARPYYAEEHIRSIAQDCAREGIPFCVGCADWHRVGEEHSEG